MNVITAEDVFASKGLKDIRQYIVDRNWYSEVVCGPVMVEFTVTDRANTFSFLVKISKVDICDREFNLADWTGIFESQYNVAVNEARTKKAGNKNSQDNRKILFD